MAPRCRRGTRRALRDLIAIEHLGGKVIREKEQRLIHRLIVARELGRQGYRWNRALRRELWQRLNRISRRAAVAPPSLARQHKAN